MREALIFYHQGKEFIVKPMMDDESPERYSALGSRLVKQGFSQNRSVHLQIQTYRAFIELIQGRKKYKISESNKDYYVVCCLALWKMGIYDPYDESSPIYISPKRYHK